jgi:hypothetical protein
MIYGYIYRVNIGSIVSLRRTPFIGCNTTSLAPAAAMPECLFFVFCFVFCLFFFLGIFIPLSSEASYSE